METHTHFHIVVFFYESRDADGNFKNSCSIDVRSDKGNITEAVKDCIKKANELAEARILDSEKTSRRNYFIKDVVEHDHALGEKEKS
jgi:hypothetical protein